MLITIQFPLIDLRRFVQEDVGLLKKPTWPIPGNDRYFIRSFGRIERRPKGGLTGWIGETYTCNANQAFKFTSLPSYVDEEGNKIRLRVGFRRFYSDGLALGKFEVGLVAWGFRDEKYWVIRRRSLSPSAAFGLLCHIMDLEIIIQSAYMGIFKGSLKNAGDRLAQYYEECTSRQPLYLTARSPQLVLACNSCVIVSYQQYKESLHFPFDGKSVNIDSEYFGCLLSSFIIPNTYPRIPLFTIGELSRDNVIRNLRIFILRLHAEKECLRGVLAAVKEEYISIAPRSKQSRLLQDYLRGASKHIRRLNGHCNKCLEGEIEYLSFSALDAIAPGEREEILRTLRIIDAERNVLGLVEQLLKSSLVTVMGDFIYSEGAVGIIKDSPNAELNISSNRTSNQNLTSFLQAIDMQRLAVEFGKLQLSILSDDLSERQRIDLGRIANAGAAAIENNPNKVSESLSALAKSGQWILGIAEKIGVPLAVEALKITLGLPL